MRLRRYLAYGLLGVMTLGCQPSAAPAATTTSAPAAVNAGTPAPTAPPALVKLNHAYVGPTESMSIPWIAKEAGFFAREGLDVQVQLVTGSPRVIQSLVAGDFQVAQVGAVAVMQAELEGVPGAIVAGAGDYDLFKIMANPQSGIRSVSDLRGHTVAVSQIGSTSHTFLKLVLSRQGMTLDDVQVLQAGGNPQAGQAMLSGAIDAATVDNQLAPTATRAGAVTVVDGSVLKIPSLRASLAAMRPWLERNRDVALRYMRAYVEAVHFYRTQRDETVRIFQQYMADVSPDEAAYFWEQGYDGHKPLPVPSDEAIQGLMDREFTAQTANMKPSDFTDLSLLRDVERSGLVTQLYQ
jgi:ABC-type nitrate/sulfonate/bicarbonate transport system substrate-binding protein